MDKLVQVDDGCHLWTANTGAGDGVLLCHGGPGMWDYIGPVAGMFDDAFAVHRWDQRGAGRSGRRGPFTIERFVEDMEALRTHFGHERWIVGGHSWGASLALQYALRYPQHTRALIDVSGTGTGRTWREAYRRTRERGSSTPGSWTAGRRCCLARATWTKTASTASSPGRPTSPIR